MLVLGWGVAGVGDRPDPGAVEEGAGLLVLDGNDPADPALMALVGELATHSPEFRTWWATHNVRLHRTSTKQMRHPVVGKLELTGEGVDIHLDVDNEFDDIPSDALALVGKRSAVGEQYVELQPQSDEKPFLEEGAEISADKTSVPVSTA